MERRGHLEPRAPLAPVAPRGFEAAVAALPSKSVFKLRYAQRVATDDCDKENASNSVAPVLSAAPSVVSGARGLSAREGFSSSSVAPLSFASSSAAHKPAFVIDLKSLKFPSFEELQERKRQRTSTTGSSGGSGNSRPETEEMPAPPPPAQETRTAPSEPAFALSSPSPLALVARSSPSPLALVARSSPSPLVGETGSAVKRSSPSPLPEAKRSSPSPGIAAPSFRTVVPPSLAVSPSPMPVASAPPETAARVLRASRSSRVLQGSRGSSRPPSLASSSSSSSSSSFFPTPSIPRAHASQSLFKTMQVNGREYIRLDRVGKGGNGTVYRCLTPLMRLCAIKKIHLEDDNPLLVASCQNEINVMQMFRGDLHIVQLLDAQIDREQRTMFLVMEYGELDLHKKLDQLKKENGSLGVNYIRLYWQQMLECVDVIHTRGVIHSDLKPANFLFVEGRLKLIDFGLAKSIPRNDTTNVIQDKPVGTLNFMSPERFLKSSEPTQGDSVKIGRPSDIWSLGCILYQMTFGVPPLSAYNDSEKILFLSTMSDEIKVPECRYPLLSTVIRRCLVRDPKRRAEILDLLSDPFVDPSACLLRES